MGNVTTLSSKFQISIPRSVREARGWKAGRRFAFVPRGSGVVLVPVPTMDELFGIARGADPNGFRDEEDRDDRY